MLVWLITLFLNINCFADTSAATGFQAGIRLMQEQKYTEAFDLLSSEYKAGRQSAALLYNWGHAALKLEKYGYALALWRRALFIDPDLTSARQSIEYMEEALSFPAQKSQLSLWQNIRSRVLDKLSLNKFLFVCWLFMVPAFYLLIRYWGARKKAIKTVSALPQAPTLGIFFSILFLISVALTVLKTVSLLEIRATVVTSATPLRTGPSEEDNTLFDISEGQDVIIKSVQNSWAHITVESDVSGWAPINSLFQHTGKKHLW